MELPNNDPLASVTELCQISSSQEQILNQCPFAFQPHTQDDNASLSTDDEFLFASTAITMVSPPQTPEDDKQDEKDDSALPNGDFFQTPPEEPAFLPNSSQNHCQVAEQQQVTVDRGIGIEAGNHDELVVFDPAAGGNRADGKGEKDLGFTVESEMTHRIEIERESNSAVAQNPSHDKEVIHCEYMEGEGFDQKNMKRKASSRGLNALNSVLDDHLIKRSELYDGSNNNDNLGLVTPQPNLATKEEKSFERLVKSEEKFKLGAPSSNLGTKMVKYSERLVKSVDVLLVGSKSANTLDEASETERGSRNLGKSVMELGSEEAGYTDSSLRSPQTEQVEEMEIEMNGCDMECSGERLVKRKLEYSTEVVVSDLEENNAVSSSAGGGVEGINREKEGNEVDELATVRHSKSKGTDVLDKISGGANACGSEKDVRETHVSPTSVRWSKENERAGKAKPDDVLSQRNSARDRLLHMLDMVLEGYPQDPSLKKLSLLEVAKMRGMTFP